MTTINYQQPSPIYSNAAFTDDLNPASKENQNYRNTPVPVKESDTNVLYERLGDTQAQVTVLDRNSKRNKVESFYEVPDMDD